MKTGYLCVNNLLLDRMFYPTETNTDTFVMLQSSSVLLKCCSLLARVGVAQFGLVKAKLPLTCHSVLDLPKRLSELAAILHVVSSDLY